jgi:hypothetical protein
MLPSRDAMVESMCSTRLDTTSEKLSELAVTSCALLPPLAACAPASSPALLLLSPPERSPGVLEPDDEPCPERSWAKRASKASISAHNMQRGPRRREQQRVRSERVGSTLTTVQLHWADALLNNCQDNPQSRLEQVPSNTGCRVRACCTATAHMCEGDRKLGGWQSHSNGDAQRTLSGLAQLRSSQC